MNKYSGTWNTVITSLPHTHFMQTMEWAQVKIQTGWEAIYRVWILRAGKYHISDDLQAVPPVAAALILQRTIRIGGFASPLRILYVPKGPLLEWDNIPLRRQVLADLSAFAKHQGAFLIKIDPDVVLGRGFPGTSQDSPEAAGLNVIDDLKSHGWRFSNEQIQFRNTMEIDLLPDESALLNKMRQKTRYNIRLADRKGVKIRPGSIGDLNLLFQMYAETSIRDGFVIRSPEYYLETWQSFLKARIAKAWIAEVGGEEVAGIIIFCFAGKAWYVYGMSREIHRDKMPNYLLQWEAIRDIKSSGGKVYDLWGAPDTFNENDPLWGVYRFKEGLGGEVIRYIGAWDLPVKPFLYRLYSQTLPHLLDVMRWKGKRDTRSHVSV
jgi:peptidoglycan pentaglycine glycine transferase (the first glycine)